MITPESGTLYHVPRWRRSLLTLSLFDRLWIRGTLLVVELPKGRSTAAPLQLWAAGDGKNQVWVLEECESRFCEFWRVAELTSLS